LPKPTLRKTPSGGIRTDRMMRIRSMMGLLDYSPS
jgi:hypothetical protein